MHLTNRRDFLRAATATAAGTVWLASAQSPEAHIDILLEEPVGTISPEIYGHFVEHLGGVVYDGIWVGERFARPQCQRPPQGAGGRPQESQAAA